MGLLPCSYGHRSSCKGGWALTRKEAPQLRRRRDALPLLDQPSCAILGISSASEPDQLAQGGVKYRDEARSFRNHQA